MSEGLRGGSFYSIGACADQAIATLKKSWNKHVRAAVPLAQPLTITADRAAPEHKGVSYA
jgi:hypothetical protein